jgi:hypothetical protein
MLLDEHIKALGLVGGVPTSRRVKASHYVPREAPTLAEMLAEMPAESTSAHRIRAVDITSLSLLFRLV